MAFNQALRLAQNTNLPGFIIMSQRWGVGATGAVTSTGATTDPGRGLRLTRTGVGVYTLAFAPDSSGGTSSVQAIVHPIVTIMDSVVPTIVQVTNITTTGFTFSVTTTAGVADDVSNGGMICISIICTNSSVLV
jgi:hypothetical protein